VSNEEYIIFSIVWQRLMKDEKYRIMNIRLLYWTFRPLEIRPPRCLETSGTNVRVIWRQSNKNKDLNDTAAKAFDLALYSTSGI